MSKAITGTKAGMPVGSRADSGRAPRLERSLGRSFGRSFPQAGMAALALAGCAQPVDPLAPQAPCPRIAILSDGADLTRFRADSAQDLTGLVVLEVEGDDLGAALRWEPSRGGDLFPHLYDVLTPGQVRAVTEAPLGPDGVPVLGDLA